MAPRHCSWAILVSLFNNKRVIGLPARASLTRGKVSVPKGSLAGGSANQLVIEVEICTKRVLPKRNFNHCVIAPSNRAPTWQASIVDFKFYCGSHGCLRV